MVLLIDNYDSFVYNLARYLEELGVEVAVVRNDAVTVEEVIGRSADAIVISPGPCGPRQAGISVELVQAVLGQVPLLGVCLGHQVLAAATGVVGASVVAMGLISMPVMLRYGYSKSLASDYFI